ncbi:glutamate racemase [Gammaproteobacteria bacterium 42_54_T18]|nr:glutamate racemase [Gammaproteobacteria bacterium 42_54_T18]
MTNSTRAPSNILIFDSGIGGLSIADEVTQALPQHPIVYIADNRLYPYGRQSDDALLARAKTLFPALERHYQPAVIIIACNSASTLILDEVRAITRSPVIGVVPAIKPAADITQTGQIGLLATKGTISRKYTLDLISEFASLHEITKIGSDVLVSQAERKLHGYAIEEMLIEQELAPIIGNTAIDTVILGCTHFPLIKQEIQNALGNKIHLIDSGEAIARRAAHILSTSNQQLPLNSPLPAHTFIFTAENNQVTKLAPALHTRGFFTIEIGNH